MSKQTVLITGSQGFTAKYLRESLLSEGYTVFGMSPSALYEWEVRADLTKPDKLRQVMAEIRPDYVIHLAGISNVVHGNDDELYQVNLHGTLNLLSAIQKEVLPVKKIILASSAYVYGNAEETLITEKTCPKPVTHYAMSKLAMEHMALALYENLSIVIVRPFNYTGVGQKPYFLIPKMVQHFSTGAPLIRLGNRDVYREFNDVRMVAHAYTQLLTKATPGSIINLCTGNNYCLQDILDLLSQISDHHLEVITDPAFVRSKEVTTLSGDPTVLNSLLPDLTQYTLEDTLRWMYFSD